MAAIPIQNDPIKILLILVISGSLWPAWAAPKAELVMDASTDTVLFENDAERPRHPASLTKMMTLYLTFHALKYNGLRLQQPLKVSQRAAAQPPSKLGLRAGKTITVEKIILALVVRSANDAATVIAEALGGTEPQFAQMMTKTARRLGMHNTTFRNASGLPDSSQISTAADMYLLARALQRDFPEFYHYFSRTSFRFGKETYKGHNRLLTKYAGTDGIKTGFIRASGFNLVASVKRDRHHIIGVIFGGNTAKSRDTRMQAILDQGFARLAVESPSRYAENAIELPAVTLISRMTQPDLRALHEAGKLSLLSSDAGSFQGQSLTLNQGSSDGGIVQPVERLPRREVVGKTANNTIGAVVEPAAGFGRNHRRDPSAQPGVTLQQTVSSMPDTDKFDWKIQVGAFSKIGAAKQHVAEIVETVSGRLSPQQATILPSAKNGIMLYRVCFGEFTEIEAIGLCDTLEQQRFDCLLLAPSNI